MTGLTVAAVDLGAESGRVAAAHFDGSRLELDIQHRFANVPTTGNGWLRWDSDLMWQEISFGLAALGTTHTVASVGVDTWGIDYGLYGADNTLLEQPVAYRDGHRIDVFDRIVHRFGAAALYGATGIQLLEINSLFSLIAQAEETPEVLERTRRLLMMPDVFHNKLSGSIVTERTAASTTGFFDMAEGRWATGLLEAVGIATGILPEIAPSGTDVGPVIGALATQGLAATRVILPPAHDTASAVLAIPGAGAETLFISSGTWSLVGVVLPEPIISAASQKANLTNEGGAGNTVRFLRNVMGLWILQECRRQWKRDGREGDYENIVRLAAAEPPLRSLINPNATEFLAPGDMTARIREYCRRHGMPVPESIGQIARTIIDSLAVTYRLAAEDIAAVTGVPITSVAVVGGGGENALLQQATANACGLPVTCWAKEATALGNAATQLRTLGELDSLEQTWQVIAESTRTRHFDPQPAGHWQQAATTLRTLEQEEAHRHGFEEPGAKIFAQ